MKIHKSIWEMSLAEATWWTIVSSLAAAWVWLINHKKNVAQLLAVVAFVYLAVGFYRAWIVIKNVPGVEEIHPILWMDWWWIKLFG